MLGEASFGQNSRVAIEADVSAGANSGHQWCNFRLSLGFRKPFVFVVPSKKGSSTYKAALPPLNPPTILYTETFRAQGTNQLPGPASHLV
jgi:hypothetical protein